MKRYKCWHIFFGWRCPQIKIQITPLQWGIGAGFGDGKLAFGIGPIAFACWFKLNTFEKGLHIDQ